VEGLVKANFTAIQQASIPPHALPFRAGCDGQWQKTLTFFIAVLKLLSFQSPNDPAALIIFFTGRTCSRGNTRPPALLRQPLLGIIKAVDMDTTSEGIDDCCAL
jgi:hypothetical protein